MMTITQSIRDNNRIMTKQLYFRKELLMKIKKLMCIAISALLVGTMANSIYAAEQSDDYTWPTESRRITQYYSSSHNAVDIGPLTPGVAGDDVYAFSQGTLYRYDYNQSAGYTARVNHPIDDLYYGAKYSHLTNPANVSGISTSGAVSNGAKIGEMNTTGVDSTGVHLHFELRQKSTEYNIYSDWYAGTPVDPAVFFPDILSAARTVNDSGFYFDADPTATEKNFTEAIYISHNGQDFDVRWIAGMNESEREMYGITDDVIEKAIDAVIDNSAYTETEQKLKAIS